MAHVFEEPISAQLSQMRLGADLMVSLRRLAGASAPSPDTATLRRKRLERELVDLAGRHARRALATDAYLVEHERLTALLDSVEDAPSGDAPIVEPDRAIGWLRDIKRMWRDLDDEGKRDLVNAVYDRVTVTSEGVVEVELTPEAQRHGAALALPERVVLARPEVSESRT